MGELFSKPNQSPDTPTRGCLENLLYCLKQGIVQLDGNLNVEYINPVACSVFRCDKEEVLGKNIIDVLKEPADLQCIQYCCEALSLGRESSFEDYYPVFEKWYRYNFQPMPTGGLAIIIEEINDPLELLRARTKMLEDEKLIREFQVIAQTGFWTFDLLKNQLYWSDEIYKIFDIELHNTDLSYETFINRVHPDDRVLVENAFKEHIQNKADYDIIHRIVVADNTVKYVRERCQTIYDDKGNPVKSVGIASDVSAIMKTKNELVKTKEVLEQAGRIARLGAFEWNLNDNSLYWSPVLRDIVEVDMHFVPDVEKGIFYKEGESRKLVEEVVYKAVQEGISYDIEVELVTAKGNSRWVRGIAHPEMENGKCIRLSGIIQDISNQKEINVLLRESEDRFRQIFEHTPSISVQGYNKNREVIFWNEASEILYGYTKDEVLGRKLEELIIPHEMRENVLEGIQRWIDHNEPINASELVLKRKDGSAVQVFSSHFMLKNIYGELEMYCIDIDISERIELLHNLEKQNNNLKEISWIQSHVLRAPLARLMALLRLMEFKGIKLQDNLAQNENGINFVQELNRAAVEMDNIIKDITCKTYQIKEFGEKVNLH